MNGDIVFPKGNEDQFIDIALQLGYNEVCFCYGLSDFVNFKSDKIKVILAIQIDKIEEIVKAKKKTDFIIVKNPNRAFFEKKINLVYDLELSPISDSVHHRESGLNQVLSVLAKKKDIIIGFNFNEILKGNRIKCIGRIIQNLKLCNKYKLKNKIYSFAKDPYEMRNRKDLQAFLRVLE